MNTRLSQPKRNTAARHAEVARRYAWAALERRKRGDVRSVDRAHLLTLIRLRELERLFRGRWGRFLPDDDAGRDDFVIVAHHIAFLRGEVEAHIVAWARAWAPWMAEQEAVTTAGRVAAAPQKFRADTLGWRLRLTDAERTALRITTIAPFDVSRADRANRNKARRREAERERRARKARAAGRLPGTTGRPKKTGAQQVRAIGGHGFSPSLPSLKESPPSPPAGAALFEAAFEVAPEAKDYQCAADAARKIVSSEGSKQNAGAIVSSDGKVRFSGREVAEWVEGSPHLRKVRGLMHVALRIYRHLPPDRRMLAVGFFLLKKEEQAAERERPCPSTRQRSRAA